MAYLAVKVFPGSNKASIAKKSDGSLEIRVTSHPEKGKANEEVIRAIAGFFNISPSSVRMVKGRGSRNKLFDIPGTHERH